MNDERLIELVRENMVLYDLENPKYSDNNYKEKIWLAIGKELNVALGSTCKNRWNQLRDQWRKNKKRKVTKSGQAYKPTKRWRYDEQMGFLEPFSRQRETIGNLDNIDIENEKPQEDSAAVETEQIVTEANENQEVRTIDPVAELTPTPVPKRQPLAANINQPPKGKKEESASAILMKYLVEKQKKEEPSRPGGKDPIDLFFESIAGKVKRFTPYYRNIAESKIFNLVQQLELEQILPSNQRSHPFSQKQQLQQFQQQEQPITSNSYSFHNLVSPNQPSEWVQSPTSSTATSNSTAASLIASFQDDTYLENN